MSGKVKHNLTCKGSQVAVLKIFPSTKTSKKSAFVYIATNKL